jgi:hypothetical protein
MSIARADRKVAVVLLAAAALLVAGVSAAQPAAPPPAPPAPPGSATAPGKAPAPPDLPPVTPAPSAAPPPTAAPLTPQPPPGLQPHPPPVQPTPPPGAAPRSGAYYGPVLPYYYYPPAILPPAKLPYEDGDPVPPGYQVKTRAMRSMVIAGAVTLGVPYLVSLLTASTVLADDSRQGGRIAALYAPIVGPFITVGTSRAEGAETFWLVLDGVAQTGGAVMLIYGLAAKEKYLQRETTPSASLAPEVILGPRAAALKWIF